MKNATDEEDEDADKCSAITLAAQWKVQVPQHPFVHWNIPIPPKVVDGGGIPLKSPHSQHTRVNNDISLLSPHSTETTKTDPVAVKLSVSESQQLRHHREPHMEEGIKA